MVAAVQDKPTLKTPADQKWGYEFGIDGVLSFEKASQWLGDCSRSTLDRLVADNKVRKGRRGKNAVFCVRSVKVYASSLEE